MRELTKEEKSNIIKEAHSFHMGETNILEKAKKIELWIGMDQEIKNYVRKYPICQLQKTTRVKNQVESILPDIPDILHRLTRYAVLIPLQNETTSSIVEALIEHYICTYGAPKTIDGSRNQLFIRINEAIRRSIKYSAY